MTEYIQHDHPISELELRVLFNYVRINNDKIQIRKPFQAYETYEKTNRLHFTNPVSWLVGWLVVFNVPSTARSCRDGTPIYCPLRRT